MICRAIARQDRSLVYLSGLECGLMDFDVWDIDPSEKVRQFTKLVRSPKYRGNWVFKTHDLPPVLIGEFLEQNPQFVVINVVRDFRDVLISRLMYNRYHLPSTGMPIECEFVKNHRELSDEKLIQQFYGTREMFQWLLEWKIFAAHLVHERYVRLRYESLLTKEGLHEAITALHALHDPFVIADSARISKIVSQAAFRNSASNGTGQANRREVKTDFHRKGIAGDHKRFLNKRQSESIRILMDGEYS